MPIPRLTAAQSRRRVARLRRAGCRVETRTLPSGDRVVLKRCPELLDNQAIVHDPEGSLPIIQRGLQRLSGHPVQVTMGGKMSPTMLDNQVPAPNALGYAVLAAFGAAALWAVFRPRRAQAQPSEPPPPPACELDTGEDFARLENWALANDVGVVYLPATATPPSPATSELARGIARSTANLVVVTSDGNFWTYTTGEPVLSPSHREAFCSFRSAPPNAVSGRRTVWLGEPSQVRWLDG